MLNKPRISIWLGLIVIIVTLIFINVAFSAEELHNSPSSTQAIVLNKTDQVPGSISVDFKDADILSVLRVIAAKGGVNIVAANEVTGTVTVKLSDVPWETALDVILKTHDYGYEKQGNIITVTTMDKLTAQKEAERKLSDV